MDAELEAIQKKILEGKEGDVAGIELLAIVLGDCQNGDSSVAIAEDLLSYFGGWDALFCAKRKELGELKQLNASQIDIILALGNLEKMMKTKEN